MLERLEQSGDLVRGELRPGGTQREWCDPEVLRRLRRASLAALRAEIEPADQRAFARFQASWQGVDRHPPGRRRASTGCARCSCRSKGLALPLEVWERDVLPRRTGAYSPAWLDQLCASGEVVWVGAGALGRRSGRVALYFRDDAPLIGPPPSAAEPPEEPVHEAVRERLQRRPVLLHRPADRRLRLHDRGAAERAVGSRVGRRGDQRRVRAAALAEAHGHPVVVAARASRAQAHVRLAPPRRRPARRPGPLVADRRAVPHRDRRSGRPPPHPGRAAARALRDRHPRAGARRGHPGRVLSLYDSLSALETIGIARRGYFVEGLGGAQFALPGAVERLRAQKDDDAAPPIVLAATDPAQPYGAVLKWPETPRRPARQAGAYVVLAGAEPVLFVERGGKGLQVLVDHDDPRIEPSLAALADAVKRGRIKRLALERVDGEPVVGSAYEEPLLELGFRAGPRKLTLTT